MKKIIRGLDVGQRLMLLVVIPMMVAVTLASLGIYGIYKSNESIKTVYEDRMVPVEDLGKISNLMLENRTYLRIALSEVEIIADGKKTSLVMNSEIAAKSADAIEHNIQVITGLWKAYMATYLTPEEKILAA